MAKIAFSTLFLLKITYKNILLNNITKTKVIIKSDGRKSNQDEQVCVSKNHQSQNQHQLSIIRE